jgi:tight adherence protein C
MAVTDLVPLLIFGVLILVGVGLVVLGLRQSSQPDAIGSRLTQFTERTMTLEELELQQPFSQRVVMPLMRGFLLWLGKYGPKQSQERLRLSLQQAGNPANLQPVQYIGIRMGLAIILFLVFGFVTFGQGSPLSEALMYTAIGGVLGYLLPSYWLGGQIKKRKKEITKALPDALKAWAALQKSGKLISHASLSAC